MSNDRTPGNADDPEPPDRLRVRDVDRITAMAALDDAYADGQLDHGAYTDRIERARTAVTFANLGRLVDDLQRRDDAPEPCPSSAPPSRTRWLAVISTILVVVALTVAVVVAVAAVRAGDDAHPPKDTAAAPQNPGGDTLVDGPMYTTDALRALITKTRQRFGTTVIDGVHLYRNNAVIHVFDKKSPNGTTHYTYSPAGGRFYDPEFYGGNSVNSGPGSPPVDLTEVDVDKVIALIADSPDKLGLTAATAGPVPFRVTIGGDNGGEIWMGVNDISLDSHLVADLKGNILGIEKCGWGC